MIYARDRRVVISLTDPQHAEELSALTSLQPQERQTTAASQRVSVFSPRALGLAPGFLDLTKNCLMFFAQSLHASSLCCTGMRRHDGSRTKVSPERPLGSASVERQMQAPKMQAPNRGSAQEQRLKFEGLSPCKVFEPNSIDNYASISDSDVRYSYGS